MNDSKRSLPSLAASLLALALALAACSSGARGNAPDGPTRGAPEPASAASAATAAEGSGQGAALLETTADLRGRGPERVHLDADGVLHVGELSTTVEAIPASAGNVYHWEAQASLRPVQLAPDTGAVLLTFPTADSEDPPNVYQLFVVTGDRLVRVLDVTVGVYGVHELEIPGDGTASYVEDDWFACERLGFPQKAILQRVTFALSDDGTEMTEATREDTGPAVECADLSACPFVYAVTGDGEVLLGEILRNLRGARSYALQSLAVPPASGRVVRLVLKEEKPEVTYLDEIYLEVGGLRVQPRACAQRGAAPVYCDAELGAHVLRQGDVLPLAFDLPPDLDASAPLLFARGHYVPVSAPAATAN